ncbi:putative signal transducing protein [Pseudoduganella violaceinigra]|uniref:putative signal transducing protein n=1 Tax=Pseudoduganella violaceinigra TaxID=246602 RepID=UPI00040BCBA4|nr:DUF2007 domain-containing protein [Pseudoduganella violaceinigra]
MLATIEIHDNLLTAHISRGLLESEEIPAFLASEHHVRASWPLAHALGGVRLQVPATCLQQARAVLAQRDSGEFEAALQEQAPHPAAICRNCGSGDCRTTVPWSSRSFVVLSYLLGGVIFPPIKEAQCCACGGTNVGEQL